MPHLHISVLGTFQFLVYQLSQQYGDDSVRGGKNHWIIYLVSRKLNQVFYKLNDRYDAKIRLLD